MGFRVSIVSIIRFRRFVRGFRNLGISMMIVITFRRFDGFSRLFVVIASSRKDAEKKFFDQFPNGYGIEKMEEIL
jgi:hypothetical protein